MGKVNGIKQFKWILELNGVDQLLFQTATLPEKTIEEVGHTEGNVKKKTPGLVTIGDLVLGKLIATDNTETFFLDWFNEVQNTGTGTGGVPAEYQRDIRVRLTDNNDNTIRLIEYTGCWIKEAPSIDLDRGASDNIMEEATIVVEDFTVIL